MNKKKKKLFITSVSTFLFSIAAVFITTSRVFADEQLIDKYQEMDSVMHISDGWLWNDLIRSVGWGLVRILVWVNNYFESVVTRVITMNDFYSSPMMEEFLEIARPLVFVLFFIAVFVLGFQFMLNKIEKRSEVLLNVLLAVSIVVVIPILMVEMNKVLGFGLGWMQQSSPSLADGVVKSNVADIKYYADNNFATAGSSDNYVGDESTPPRPVDRDRSNVGTTELKYANQLPETNADLWIIEKLEPDYDGVSDFSQEMLEQKSVPTGTGGNSVIELRDNQVPLTNLGEESYYRYHVNWGVLLFSLLITSFALVVTVIKIGRAIFDLAFHQIFGMAIAVTDLTGGQKTKKILAEIANTLGVIFIMVFILKLFTLFANWANSLSPNIGSIGVVLLLIAGAWAVIDAPDVVQRLMGIDAGLRSGYQALMGAYAGSRLAGGMAKGATSLAGGLATKGAGLANFGANAIKGASGGQRSKMNVANMPPGGGGGKPPNGGGGDDDKPPIIPPSGGGTNPPPLGGDGGGGKPPTIPSSSGGGTILGNQQVDGTQRAQNTIPTQDDTSSINRQGQGLQGTNGTSNDKNTTQPYKRTDRTIPVNPNAITKGTAGQVNQNQQIGKRSEGSIPNNTGSGYTQRSSGILVPDSGGSNEGQASMPKQGGYTPPVGGGTNKVQTPMPSQGNYTPMQTQQMYDGSGGWISGSQKSWRFKDEVSRAGNSGYAVGRGIRKAGSMTGKGMMNTTRSIIHPKKSMNYAGAKIETSKANVIRKGSDTLTAGKNKAQNVIKEIKTPVGEKRISEKNMKINRGDKQ